MYRKYIAKWPPSWIDYPFKNEIDPLCCQIHDFILFLDELAQETVISEVSLRLVEVLYAFFAVLKSVPKNWFSEE